VLPKQMFCVKLSGTLDDARNFMYVINAYFNCMILKLV
jgi:hypothetical protein